MQISIVFIHLWIHHINLFIHPGKHSMQTWQVHGTDAPSQSFVYTKPSSRQGASIIKNNNLQIKNQHRIERRKGMRSLMLVKEWTIYSKGEKHVYIHLHSFHMIAWGSLHQNPQTILEQQNGWDDSSENDDERNNTIWSCGH